MLDVLLSLSIVPFTLQFMMVQSYTASPNGVALTSADAPVVISLGAMMVMVGQVPRFVIAEAVLFDGFASAAALALTVNCTSPVAEEAMCHAVWIVADCP